MRSRSRLIVVATLAAMLTISIGSMADAATVTSWKAPIGSAGTNGYATLVTTSTGVGTIRLVARRLTARATYPVEVRSGSCTGPRLFALTSVVASSSGTILKSYPLTAARVTQALAAARLYVRIGSSTRVRCGRFIRLVIPPPPIPGSFGDGTHVVGGTGIAPGTYQTAGGPACYWARLSGFGGTLQEIIANGFGPGQQLVTIAATDVGFISTTCGTWIPTTLPSPLPSPTPTPAPSPCISGCMGQRIDFGNYSIIVNRVTLWPDGLPAHPQPAGWVLASVNITISRAVAGTMPLSFFAIEGPSNTPYDGPLVDGEKPALDLIQTIGTSTGYLTFSVRGSDYGQLTLRIGNSAVVHLY